MRHRKNVIKLGRKTAHRKAMLANMASSLIEHKRINSTLTKVKALKVFIEPLITKSKTDNTHNRRICFSKLRDKIAVATLFDEVAKKIGDRPGGYTRIIKLGNRMGDNASMAMIELVDFNDIYNTEEKLKKKTRRRGGSKAKANISKADEVTKKISNEANKSSDDQSVSNELSQKVVSKLESDPDNIKDNDN